MNESSLRYEGWRVAGASAVGVFFAALCFVTFNILLKPLAAEFAWSRAAVSSAFATMTLTAALSAPTLGYLLDRLRPQHVAAMGLAVGGSAFASLSVLTSQLWHLYAVFAVLGAAATATSAVAYARPVASWFDSRRGMALGLVISGAAVGTMVHPLVAQALMRAVGWRTVCLILGGSVVIIGVPIVSRLVRARSDTTHTTASRLEDSTLGEALRSRAFWLLLTVVFGGTIALNGVTVHLSALLTDRGVSAADAATVVATLGAGSLTGRLLTGWLLDHFSAARVLFVLLSIAAIGTFLLAGAPSLSVAVLAVLMIGFGTGGEVDVIPYMLSRYFGLASVSTLYGLIWAAWGIAGAVGPILMGRAYDLTASYESTLHAFAVCTLAAGSLMFAAPALGARQRLELVREGGGGR